MKRTWIAVFALLASNSAWAAYGGPLLTRFFTNGYAPIGQSVSTTCEIYADRMVITRNANGLQSTETKPIVLSGQLARAIADSRHGPFFHPARPCDQPAFRYTAFHVNPDDSVLQVPIANDDCPYGTENRGEAGYTLKNFLDLNCGK